MEEEEVMRIALSEMIEENYQTVIYQMTKHLANNQNNYNALVLRASAYCEKGEYANALNDYLSAEKIMTKPNADFMYMKAKASYYNQDFEGSKSQLEKALGREDLSDEQKNKMDNLMNKMKLD